jgi:SAM-dependent methyltransferase
MIGAKAGDQVLMMGADDADLAAAVALVTGLNGRTLVVDARADRGAAIETAAANAGTLVEFHHGELDTIEAADAFDVAVLITSLVPLSDDARASLTTHVVRALRPGGRVVVADGRRSPSGFLRGLSKAAPRLDPAVLLAVLGRAGLRATRQLADSEGVAFYEGRK